MTRKKNGCCTLCDAEVCDSVTRWPGGHPYAGDIRAVGEWHDDAMKLTFILSGGSTIDLTFCEACGKSAESQLPAIWQKSLAANASDIDNDIAIGIAPSTATYRFNRQAFHVRLANEIPLGVMSRRYWKERDQVDHAKPT